MFIEEALVTSTEPYTAMQCCIVKDGYPPDLCASSGAAVMMPWRGWTGMWVKHARHARPAKFFTYLFQCLKMVKTHNAYVSMDSNKEPNKRSICKNSKNAVWKRLSRFVDDKPIHLN